MPRLASVRRGFDERLHPNHQVCCQRDSETDRPNGLGGGKPGVRGIGCAGQAQGGPRAGPEQAGPGVVGRGEPRSRRTGLADQPRPAWVSPAHRAKPRESVGAL